MRSSRKVISLIVAVLVIFTMTIPAYASFSDTAKHWASTQITKWVEKGIINGNPNGTYAPDKAISRAEFSSIITKLFNYVNKSGSNFSDVSAKAWYADVVSKAAGAGVIVGDSGKFRPTASITREEAAVIFYRAFALQVNEIAAASKYADAKDIDSWAKEAVSAVSEKGYMKGQPGNKFAPKANVTRAEAVKMVDNALEDLKNKAGSYSGTVNKGLIVNTADVTLKDMVINGDLILAQGIGDGNVTLDNVKVSGRTVVMGGGANSIHLVNSSLNGTLLVIKKDGKVRIVAEGSTSVAGVQLASGAKLEEDKLTGTGFGNVQVLALAAGQEIILAGDFDKVVVSDANAVVEITSGKVGTLEIAKTAAGASVSIAAGAAVTTLVANAAVEVSGTGTIATADINAAGVVIAQKPAKVDVAPGITASVAGTQTSNTNTTTTNSNNSGNNSGNTNTSTSPISSVVLTTVGGTPINASVIGSIYTFDLSDVSDNTFINGIKITSSQVADTLKSSVVSGSAMTGTNGTFAFAGNNSIVDAFLGVGTFDGNISVKTIKSIWSAGTIIRNISVYSGSQKVQDITLAVRISSGYDLLGTQSLLDAYTLTPTTGGITAKLDPKLATRQIPTGTNFIELLKRMVTVPTGYTLSEVQITTAGGITTTYTGSDLTTANGWAILTNKLTNMSSLTLGSFTGKTVTFKVVATSPAVNKTYTIHFQ